MARSSLGGGRPSKPLEVLEAARPGRGCGRGCGRGWGGRDVCCGSESFYHYYYFRYYFAVLGWSPGPRAGLASALPSHTLDPRDAWLPEEWAGA